MELKELQVIEEKFVTIMEEMRELYAYVNQIKDNQNDKPKEEPKKRGRKPKTITIIDDSNEPGLTIEV